MTIPFVLTKPIPYIASAVPEYKERYINLCRSAASIPLYMTPGWLDAVCNKGEWNVCLSFDGADRINGALVYYLVRLKSFIPAIVMPEITPHSGIWFEYPPDFERSKLHTQNAYIKKIVASLVDQLPDVPLYHQKFHHQLTDWQPFYWKGYQGATHYTYILENITDLAATYENFKGSVRTDIKKAEKSIIVEASDDLNGFYRLCEISFEKQGRKPNFSKEVVHRLDKFLKPAGLRDIYMARDAEGTLHAGIYIVYSGDVAHYLIGGSDPKFRQNASMSFLLWRSICEASKRSSVFDFEGSMLPAVEYSFRNFGAVQKPFFRITKSKNLLYEALTLFFKDYK